LTHLAPDIRQEQLRRAHGGRLAPNAINSYANRANASYSKAIATSYDALDRQALLSLVQPGDPGNRKRLIVLVAYIDDTGTHDAKGQQPGSEVAGAVGYLSRFKQWAKLTREWRRTLHEHGVKVFHAAHLRWRRGEFIGWSDDRERALIDDLTRLATRYTMFGVGGLLLVKDYMELSQWFRDEIRDPYFVGLKQLFDELLQGPCAEEIRGETINFFFDRQNRLGPGTTEMFDVFSIHKARGAFGTLGFGDKEKIIPLQCADLIAYNVRAEVARMVYKPDLEILPAMKRLLKENRIDVAYCDEAGLKDLFFKRVIQRALSSPETAAASGWPFPFGEEKKGGGQD
jgi:Protein of unknown function (DUF3800)